jgi:FAD/FMN-containing dehydrogenase
VDPAVDAYRRELIALLGDDRVILPGKKISRYLRDFSWYSPILENALSDTAVEAVALPSSLDELTAIVALAARHRVPLTMRGAGTGNYGQSLPLVPGLVIDVKGVNGVIEVAPGRIAVLPGTVMRDAENAAKATGQELAVMPSTFRVATASGFISGGSGGLGASANGDLWNGNILAVELITVEEAPRLIRLEGDEVHSVLHVYGTVGVITRVEMRLVPSHAYDEFIVEFPSAAGAVQLGWEAVADPSIQTRLISVHEAPLGATMTPIADSIDPGAAIVLAWVGSEHAAAFTALAEGLGGHVIPWPDGAKDVTQFVYSHSILWSRRAFVGSSWLQCDYASLDAADLQRQVAAIQARYDGVFLQHLEIITGPGGVRAVGVPALVGLPDHEEALEELIGFCRDLGIIVLNPHSYVVEEGGFVGDTSRMLALKAEADPFGLLNPGKLGTSFFAERGAVRDVELLDVVAPEQLHA